MIMDTCVLIDFIKAERALLALVVKQVGPLHVTSPVIDEVNEIDRESQRAR
jgi:predicted nucleic acid-binding protein